MLDSINNMVSRMNEIKGLKKKFTSYKPEFVQDFENMYKEAISKNPVKNKKEDAAAVSNAEKKYSLQNENNMNINRAQKEQIDQAVKAAAKKYNVSEDLINAIITAESAYDQFAVSKAGAMGLMQLMPRTLLMFGVEKPFDIYQNIEGGVKYFKILLDRYNGSIDNALAAYNAGADSVDKAGGVPDIKETKDYVKFIKKRLIS
jgi:soluble lytic murein transglycosylase-like protein